MKQTIILPEKVTKTIAVTQEIDPKQWVRVNGTPYFVNKSQALNGYSWEDALRQALTTTPFRVTPPSILTPHYAQVCASVRKRNPVILYDGAGEPFSRSARDDIYEQRTTDTWIWSDAFFEERSGKLWLLTDHQEVNNTLQPQTSQPLEKRIVQEDGIFTDLQFNRQGFPVKKSQRQVYQRGKNLFFSRPRPASAVGFYAGSDRFYLDCSVDLQNSIAALGVLLYAKGVAKK